VSLNDPNALRRAQLRKAAQLRAEFAFNDALARIDFLLDEVGPAKDAIAAEFARGELQETNDAQLGLD
jgi:hypothetical protein